MLNEVGGLAEWETAATSTNGYSDLVQHRSTAAETRNYSFIWMGSKYRTCDLLLVSYARTTISDLRELLRVTMIRCN